MNRGSQRSLKLSPQACPSFNEAPIHESGKFGFGRARLPSVCHRFNEAPIHESGKSETAKPAEHEWSCFNEAPIHESGK